MKLYWFSNAAWSTSGYGVQTELAARVIPALGHEMVMGAWFGLQGSPRKWGDQWVFPAGKDTYGNDVFAADTQFTEADIAIWFGDIWVAQPRILQQVRTVPYVPIDHDPAPPKVIDVLTQGAWDIIAYSKFGVRKLHEAGLKCRYVPHMVDSEVLRPMDKAEARKALGCPPDAFLVGIVAANRDNPSRKWFEGQIRAFAKLRAQHSDAMLYLHTELQTPWGEDIPAMIETMGIPPSAIAIVDQYKYGRGLYDQGYLRNVYAAMDVFSNCTRGEGFGVPIIEAQACGVPAIVTDFTAMPELVPDGSGWKVAVDSDDLYWSQNSYWATPKPSRIYEAYEAAYQCGDLRERGAAARAFIKAKYSIPHVSETYWKPVLAAIAERVTEESNRLNIVGIGFTNLCEAGHDWAATAIWDNGELCVPCRRNGCEAERRQRKDGMYSIEPRGFKAEANGVALDIEDDPQGGVAKIVLREIEKSYDLDSIPFEAGDTVIDIGAQVGVVSCYLAKKHPDIKVLAYEPVPENYARLVRNLKANGIENVTAINSAVTGDGRDLTLIGHLDKNSGGISAFTSNGHGEAKYIVPSVTLADVFRVYNLSRVKLLKIDCEGAEYEILRHFGPLDKIDYVRGEFHSNAKIREMGETPEKLRGLLDSHIDPEHVKVHYCEIAA